MNKSDGQASKVGYIVVQKFGWFVHFVIKAPICYLQYIQENAIFHYELITIRRTLSNYQNNGSKESMCVVLTAVMLAWFGAEMNSSRSAKRFVFA